MFLLDLGAVADAQAAMDAKGRLFFEPVWIRSVFFRIFLQDGRIRGVGHLQLEDHFSNPVDLRRSGLNHQSGFRRIDAGDNRPKTPS